MSLTWFRQPHGDDPGTLNVCYHAVDVVVIRGGATEPAVRHPGGVVDFAGLLELVAALGGAFAGLGVEPGTSVAVLLDDPFDTLLAQLAGARVGATVVDLDADDATAGLERHRPHLVTTSRPLAYGAHTPAATLVRGTEVEDERRDLDWEVAVKAGRTDPAASRPVAPGDPAYVTGDRSVTAADLPGDDSVLGRAVATLAARGTVELA